MKKRLSFIIAALIMLMLGAQVFGAHAAAAGVNPYILPTDAESEPSGNTNNVSAEQNDESTLFEEPENKRFAWLYILIAVAAVVFVIAAMVFISKK